MLNKSISISKQVNKLSVKSQLIFTWIIPHLDDYGLITNDSEILKALVFPMNKEIEIEDIEVFLKDAEKSNLIDIHKECLKYSGFNRHQSISESKKSASKFNIPEKPQEVPRSSKKPPLKRREEKITKEKITKEKRGYLTNLPKQDLEKFTKRFVATETEIISKAEDLELYCRRKGKTYQDYPALLLNALKKDFKERSTKKSKYSEI